MMLPKIHEKSNRMKKVSSLDEYETHAMDAPNSCKHNSQSALVRFTAEMRTPVPSSYGKFDSKIDLLQRTPDHAPIYHSTRY